MSLTWNEENLLATGVKGNPDRGGLTKKRHRGCPVDGKIRDYN